MADTPLLQVDRLRVRVPTAFGPADAVRGVDFALRPGETLGLVGESGCGKSLTALALMGLWPERAQVSGSIRFEGRELVGLDERTLCTLRGNRLAMVFQEPMSALNPVHPVGRQVAEPLRLHRGLSARAARTRAVELLERVGITGAAQRVDAYPHQFSGGQRQRIMIAMALACEPRLLIADEPTTALDVTVAGQILSLIGELVRERDMALVLISHDLGVIARHVSRTLVMYGGTVVEDGPTEAVFRRRAHPYTEGLFGSRPQFGPTLPTPDGRRPRLPAIAGSVPELHRLPAGCPFAERCPRARDDCPTRAPQPVVLGPDHHARCLWLEAAP